MAGKKLNQNQIKELKECFDFFDVDQSGSISTDELKKLFEKLGFHVNESELQNIIQLMDKDGSGQVDFDEFSNVMAGNFFKTPTQAELEAAFDYFDSDKSGFISEEELFKVMTKFRGSTTKKEIYHMVQKIDKDSDGRINKAEFIKLVTSS